ncbi:O-antigen ligase family protein [Patescibacteria group bacterium]|nr:O-antigen ligase family protein [Patescibacteria group bacterium]
MLSHSFIKTKINWQQILLLISGFFALRLLSFLLKDSQIGQDIFVWLNVLLLLVLFYKNKSLAWYYLLLEFILGGAGLFFQSFALSLRTILTLEFLGLYFLADLKIFKKDFWYRNKKALLFFVVALLFLISSLYLGLKNNHPLLFIVQDLLPFIFFLLVFPAKEYFNPEKISSQLLNGLLAFLAASSLWSMFNLILFRTGISVLHADYYNWLRDFALAKITYLDSGFWRIVFPEHLLLVPAMIFLIALYIKTKDKLILIFLALANIILALNISRAYLLALLVALLILKYQTKIFTWFKICAITLFGFILIFFAINLSVSAGKNLGLNILGLRLPGITQINTDPSANNRLQLLGPIWKNIQNSPLFGQGLGLDLTFVNTQKQSVTTRHFDWGYLEIWAKFGLFFLVFFISLWLILIKNLFKQKQAFALACVASLVAILVSNILAQTSLHILGVIFFSLSLAFSQNSKADIL